MTLNFPAAARRAAALTAGLAMLWPLGAARGWDDAGHKAVAQIALDNLPAGSPARTSVDAILAADPRKTQMGGARDGTLLTAAIWPDVIKHRPNPPNQPNIDKATGAPQDPDWHFVDIPFDLTDPSDEVEKTINRPDTMVDPKADDSANVVTAIRFYTDFLKSGSGTAAEKADALAWLTHLVGDIHQPLHCATVVQPLPNYTPPMDKGDRGGNGFALSGKPNNLHAFWDDQMDLDHAANPQSSSHPDGVPPLTDAEITTRARAAAFAHPAASFGACATTLDPEAWAKESFAFRPFVYSGTPKKKPAADYAARAKGIAEERIALAGYRLANLLQSIFPANAARPAAPARLSAAAGVTHSR